MQMLERSEKLDNVVDSGGRRGPGALRRPGLRRGSSARVHSGLPRIHVCQPAGGFPFVRAYLLALAEIARRSGFPFDLDYQHGADPGVQLEKTLAFARDGRDQIQAVADFVERHFDSPATQSFLIEMAGEAGRFMWPWDGGTPHSLAHGILDDVTYDWYYLLRAVLRTGGRAEILARTPSATPTRWRNITRESPSARRVHPAWPG